MDWDALHAHVRVCGWGEKAGGGGGYVLTTLLLQSSVCHKYNTAAELHTHLLLQGEELLSEQSLMSVPQSGLYMSCSIHLHVLIHKTRRH